MPSRSGGPDMPVDAPPNQVDNRGYLKTAKLTPAQQQSGNAAATRISEALGPLRHAMPYDRAAFVGVLQGLGYREISVVAGLESAAFDVQLPDGGCVSGTVRAGGLDTAVHGVYIEGTGCTRPTGGH